MQRVFFLDHPAQRPNAPVACDCYRNDVYHIKGVFAVRHVITGLGMDDFHKKKMKT
jgi:hypothetical protein